MSSIAGSDLNLFLKIIHITGGNHHTRKDMWFCFGLFNELTVFFCSTNNFIESMGVGTWDYTQR